MEKTIGSSLWAFLGILAEAYEQSGMDETLEHERAYWLAWSQVPGVGPTLLFRLKNHFGSLKVAWDAPAQELMAVEGIGDQTAHEIVTGRSPLQPGELLEQHVQTNPHFWTPADDEYPQLLREIPDPPPVLYYRGQVNADENRGSVPAIAIVGTRTPSDYGKRWTQRITKALVQAGLTVVSGLADGVDAEAHRSCLKEGGRTIAVVGTGVNIVYPWTNRRIAEELVQKGLILSEYPAGTKPDRAHFPRRNRIIAGLCRAILVLEAPVKSGALITARLAIDYNRDVYALPGSLDNASSLGCLHLIHQGAQMILDEYHLLDMLGTMPQFEVQQGVPPSPQPERHQMSLLPQMNSNPSPTRVELPDDLDCVFQAVPATPISLDRIVESAGLPTGAVLAALAQLEIMELVTQKPGMMYQRP